MHLYFNFLSISRFTRRLQLSINYFYHLRQDIFHRNVAQVIKEHCIK